ncbi:hypothetical protein OHQ89_12540 [Streptomyces canus]|uniref:hypothetical protein n=1 Tax=Streptomyces canus TaxID=58343 RepID=UPI0030DF249B
MSYIPTAPDLKVELADTIRRHRKSLTTSKYATHSGANKEEAGRYTTVGNSLVTVQAVLTYISKAVWGSADPGDGYERRIEVGAVANCHGHGCTDPKFSSDATGHFLLGADADVTAEATLPHVQKAREWAQKHAETCRAQAYTS